MHDDRLREALARLRGGSAAAFEQIYTELSTPLFTVILRITGDREASEDILQEVLFKLYRAPPLPVILPAPAAPAGAAAPPMPRPRRRESG